MENFVNTLFEEVPVVLEHQKLLQSTENTLFLLSKSKDEEISNSEIEDLLTDLFFSFKRRKHILAA